MDGDFEHLGEEPEAVNVLPDASVTRELFLKWRSPRLGSSNPELMTNPVWEWLVKSGLNAYQATDYFQGPSAHEAGPWCFQRFGQSSTGLPDGRLILIAGEHEDYYDSDFFIYNDVVVKHPDGRIDIYGYPHDIFPPTDSHSATLVENRIIIIGCLGYPKDRRPESTPVFVLDTETLAISPIETHGVPPGWIHEHDARLDSNGASILLQRGILDRGDPDKSLVENIDDWKLHLADWRWERLTDRQWQRWEVRLEDGRANHLFEIQQADWRRKFPEFGKSDQFAAELGLPSLEEELGGPPDLDVYSRRYRPEVQLDPLETSKDEYNVHRIKVDGVVVRYVEDMHCVQMTVEGDLPQVTIDALAADLLTKMTALERKTCTLKRL